MTLSFSRFVYKAYNHENKNQVPNTFSFSFTEQKKLKLDEFLPIFSQVKKDKDQGGFEDFMECLKLYDKAENGTMMAAELSHVLLSLG